MRRSAIILTTASVLAVAAAVPAAMAQTDLVLGSAIRGALDASDRTAPGWDGVHYYDDYRIQVRAGHRIEAVMRSDVLDSYLELYRDVAQAPIATNDDGMGYGLHARLRHTAEEDGVYILRARSFGDDETGPYDLSLIDLGVAPPTPRPEPITVGASVAGTLSADDPETDQGGPYDAYALRLRQGERVTISLTSDAFDAVLRVGQGAGAFREIAMDDDSGGELNARLVFTAPDTGDFIIRATAWNPSSVGDYTLSVEAAAPPPTAQPIRLGQRIEGRLSQGTASGEDGVRHDPYRLSAQAGQRIMIDMTSRQFDAYLELGRDGPGGFERIDYDDDSGEVGTDARLIHTFDADGDYIIRARAYSSGVGAYTLTADTLAPAAPPRPLAFDQVIQGEIGDSDFIDDYGRRMNRWLVEAREGQRLQLIMRSGDFDAFLEIGHAAEPFESLAQDDDGLGEGLDARLNFTAPATGLYEVRARPYSASSRGLYSLQLSDRGPEPAPGSLMIGATTRGRLDGQDSTNESGGFYDAYRFNAKAGDQLRITLVSNDFDAVVTLGEEVGGVFEEIASDDDGLSDLNAQLDHTIRRDGVYVIRAGSYRSGSEGDYALSLERRVP